MAQITKPIWFDSQSRVSRNLPAGMVAPAGAAASSDVTAKAPPAAPVTSSAPQSAAKERDQRELTEFLVAEGIPMEVIEHLTAKKVVSLKIFSQFISSADSISTLLDGHAAASEPDQVAILRFAWRKAAAMIDGMLSRTQQGLRDTAPDEPLRPEQIDNIVATFLSFYNLLKIVPSRFGSDALITRVRKEFESNSVTISEIEKVKTLAEARGSSASYRTLMGGLRLEIGNTEDTPAEQRGHMSMLKFQELFRILMTVWAACGCYEVVCGSSKVIYCHMSDANDYMYTFLDQAYALLVDYLESSVYEYIRTVELAIRAKAIELSRGPSNVAWGSAIMRAISLMGHIWQQKFSLLVLRDPRRLLRNQPNSASASSFQPEQLQLPPPPRVPNVPPSKQRKGEKGSSKGSGTKTEVSKWQTSSKTRDGQQICQAFNDKRVCKNSNCNLGVHKCDVRLQSGGVTCGADHRRINHDPVKHGQPTMR